MSFKEALGDFNGFKVGKYKGKYKKNIRPADLSAKSIS